MSELNKPHHQTQTPTDASADALQVDYAEVCLIRPQGTGSTFDRIQLPDPIRDSPPAEYSMWWRHAGKSFPGDLRALTLLATTGWSSRLSLNHWLVENDPKLNSTNTGTIGRLWNRLEARGLVEQRTVQVSYRPKIQVALIWFSDDGYRFLREMGLPAPVICEWDRLRLVHNGPQQPVHTAMVVLTAHYMRQRGYHTLICPTGLDSLYSQSSASRLILSPVISAPTWGELESLHRESRRRKVEGFMLKRLDSEYQVGRRRGSWWKWKVDPLTVDAVMIYAQRGHGRRAGLYTDYTFAVQDGDSLVPFAKAYSGLSDAEIREVDRFIQRNTIDRYGPVRSVRPELVFEIAFEGIQKSTRHKSGVAVRFPRIARWRRDKPTNEIDTIETLHRLLAAT